MKTCREVLPSENENDREKGTAKYELRLSAKPGSKSTMEPGAESTRLSAGPKSTGPMGPAAGPGRLPGSQSTGAVGPAARPGWLSRPEPAGPMGPAARPGWLSRPQSARARWLSGSGAVEPGP